MARERRKSDRTINWRKAQFRERKMKILRGLRWNRDLKCRLSGNIGKKGKFIEAWEKTVALSSSKRTNQNRFVLSFDDRTLDVLGKTIAVLGQLGRGNGSCIRIIEQSSYLNDRWKRRKNRKKNGGIRAQNRIERIILGMDSEGGGYASGIKTNTKLQNG